MSPDGVGVGVGVAVGVGVGVGDGVGVGVGVGVDELVAGQVPNAVWQPVPQCAASEPQ